MKELVSTSQCLEKNGNGTVIVAKNGKSENSKFFFINYFFFQEYPGWMKNLKLTVGFEVVSSRVQFGCTNISYYTFQQYSFFIIVVEFWIF